LLAHYDHASSCWKTSQATFDLDSRPSSLTLPAWGMTRGGELFELPMSERLTSEPDSSSLLGTPSAADAMGGHLGRGGELLPTPVAQDDQKQPAARLAKKVDSGAGETITSLTVITRQYAATGEWSNKLLPTPSANDHTGAEGPTRAARQENGSTGGPSLRDVRHLLPTTTATERPQRTMHARGVNPVDEARHRAAGRLTGASTSQPSDAGSISPDAPPPGQLMIEDV